MIPCRENGCLKYPVCKSKVTIFCTILYNYLYSSIEKQDEAYLILTELIDCYRDQRGLRHSYAYDTFDGAPIMNSKRLMGKIEKDNVI